MAWWNYRLDLRAICDLRSASTPRHCGLVPQPRLAHRADLPIKGTLFANPEFSSHDFNPRYPRIFLGKNVCR